MLTLAERFEIARRTGGFCTICQRPAVGFRELPDGEVINVCLECMDAVILEGGGNEAGD